MLKHARTIAAALLMLLVSACAAPTARETAARAPSCPPCPACPACPGVKPPEARAPTLTAASFAELPGWTADAVGEAWSAFLASCRALRFQPAWQPVCTEAAKVASPGDAAVRAFLEANFVPFRIASGDGEVQGLVTGYYEPLLRGSRARRAPFLYPLYAPPDDLLVIDLAAVNPELKGLRLRGRLDGRRVVPYYSRAEIDNGAAPVAGKEIVWVDDPVEAFFLQVQGSGRVRLEDGRFLRVGYADQNGHPYRSIGRWLVESGELPVGEASMQGIQRWARANPQRLGELLNQNPSYVFFRELPDADGGPPGALGVPLTPERSIAVDPRHIPLGAPVWLATTRPASDAPLERLVLAQDTGGAIRGAPRADFFWGFGPDAGREAGRMRQQGRMWVLLPRGFPLPGN
ncbi:MAG: MltA domain-containing protein [Burkholderiales bacterium]|nr:MltA domain-containing protein [Burkholderiales bacterium]